MKEKKESLEHPKRSSATNPFRMMRRFSKDMERLFEDFEGGRFPQVFGSMIFPFPTEPRDVEWVPQIEVQQNNGQFVVRADLPGLTKDDIKVELKGDILTIEGERKEEKEEKSKGFYRSERRYGSFYRQLPVPQGAQTEKAEATFKNGVLEITFPAPMAETQPRKLEVKDATEEKKHTKAAASG